MQQDAGAMIVGLLAEAGREMNSHSPEVIAERRWNTLLADIPPEEELQGRFFVWHDKDRKTGDGIAQEAISEYFGNMTPEQIKEWYIMLYSDPYEAGIRMQHAVFDYARRCAGDQP